MRLDQGIAVLAAAGALIVTLGAGPARAELTPDIPSRPRSEIGVAVVAGAGITRFTTGDIRLGTGIGGVWAVRAAAGTRRHLGAEVTYVGTAQGLHGFGLTDSRTLLSNGVEATVRVSAQINLTSYGVMAQPFVFGGLGWAHYSIASKPADAASLAATDDVITAPFGGGIAAAWRHMFFEVRFTYRPTFHQNLLSGVPDDNLTAWMLGTVVGYEF
jgi:hypothetical protein